MSLNWTVEAPPLSINEEKYRNVAERLLGDRLSGVGMNVARMMSLYRFLVQNRTRGPAELAAAITENGKPIFTPAEISEMLTKIGKQNIFPFTQMLEKQHGGASSPMEMDPSRNKFWDRIIRKLTWQVSEIFPPSWDGFFWYASILYSIEQMEIIGPFFSTALDTITLSLPVLADLAEEVVGKVISLAPVPYASFVGEAVGYAIALMFVVWAVFINMSRRHFGSAFKVALEGIPFMGDVLSEAAMYFETGAERYIQNRGRMLGIVEPVSPSTYQYLNYWVPDDKIHIESMPSFPNYGIIKRNVSKYVLKATGADKMIEAAESAQKSILGGPAALAAAAQGAAMGAVSEKVAAASGSVNKKTKKASAPMTTTLKRGGGRKRTRRFRR